MWTLGLNRTPALLSHPQAFSKKHTETRRLARTDRRRDLGAEWARIASAADGDVRIIAPGVIYPIDWRKGENEDEPCHDWIKKKEQDEKGVQLWKEGSSTAGSHPASSAAPMARSTCLQRPTEQPNLLPDLLYLGNTREVGVDLHSPPCRAMIRPLQYSAL